MRLDEYYVPERDDGQQQQDQDARRLEDDIQAALMRCKAAGANDDDLRLLAWQAGVEFPSRQGLLPLR